MADPDPPPRWPTSACSGPNCGAQVIWAVTIRGESMPVDVEPVRWPDGNLLLRERAGAPLTVVVTNPAAAFGKRLHRSHFATCLNAGMFRRRAAAPPGDTR